MKHDLERGTDPSYAQEWCLLWPSKGLEEHDAQPVLQLIRQRTAVCPTSHRQRRPCSDLQHLSDVRRILKSIRISLQALCDVRPVDQKCQKLTISAVRLAEAAVDLVDSVLLDGDGGGVS